jgi:exodeoxyribonuclease V alpha subunit
MTALGSPPPADDFAPARALGAPEPLRTFNSVGVLSAADLHVARVLAELAGGADVGVQLAIALAVRAPRLGHVFVDLATVRDTAAVESDEVVDLSALPGATCRSGSPRSRAAARWSRSGSRMSPSPRVRCG